MPRSVNKQDALDALAFARDLEHVKAGVWERIYPENSAFRLFPQGERTPPGAQTITWRETDRTGTAKIIASYADDLPRVDVLGAENTSHVRVIGASYGYSREEIRNAQFANKPLEQARANAARDAHELEQNLIAWFGRRDHNIRGILETANANLVAIVTAAAAPNGTGWNATSGKTPDEILADLHNLVQASRTASNDIERVDTVVLPPDPLAYIRTTARSANSDTTILQFFMANHPEIREVTSAIELTSVAAASMPSGGASANVGMAYKRSPDKMSHEITMPFTQHPEQWRNLEAVIPCESKTGGIIVYRPLAISFMEGM
jgi:hypothetical protein